MKWMRNAAILCTLSAIITTACASSETTGRRGTASAAAVANGTATPAAGVPSRWAESFAYTARDGTVWLADAATGEQRQLVAESIDPAEIGADHNARWSPGGRYLSYQTRSNALRLLDVDTGNEITIDEGTSPRFGFTAAWSSDAARLAYIKRIPGQSTIEQGDLWVASIGEAPRRLATGVRQFEWSPDGKHIAYAVRAPDDPRGYNGDPLFVVDVVTGETRRLAELAVPLPSPIWSPDSRYIAFWRTDGIGSAIVGDMFVQDVISGREIPLGRMSSDEIPQWAPASGDLIFQHLLIDPASATARPLFERPAAIIGWSPHASKAAVVIGSGFGKGDNRLAVFDRAGTIATLFSSPAPESHAGNPGYWGKWSGNGRYFAFSTISETQASGAYVADTTNAHVQAIDLPASLGPYSLVFSPDGTRLLISARTDADDLVIVVANADGSDPHKAADGRAPEWRPVPNDR